MLPSNEKVAKVVKKALGKGVGSLVLNSDSKEALLSFDTGKELYSFKVRKNDFAEENARSRRLFKKNMTGWRSSI